MIPDFLQILQVYMVPFAIGIPIALLVFFFGTRKIDDLPDELSVEGNKAAVEGRKISVLVVDDSAVARAKFRKLFEAQGYRVETASNGSEALETLAKSRFSVLVTDLEMPVMDGFELIAAVQGNMETDDLPIIAVTGHDELQARVNDCRGLFGIFKKPWNDRELLKRVAALSSLRSPATAN